MYKNFRKKKNDSPNNKMLFRWLFPFSYIMQYPFKSWGSGFFSFTLRVGFFFLTKIYIFQNIPGKTPDCRVRKTRNEIYFRKLIFVALFLLKKKPFSLKCCICLALYTKVGILVYQFLILYFLIRVYEPARAIQWKMYEENK